MIYPSLMSKPDKTGDVDVVITWVDPTDPEWVASRNRYLGETKGESASDNSDARYRDWDTVRYLLRSIDKNLPWVRTVHFVTCGHLPSWLDPNADGLHIVNHRDYIPEQYLPTFSSHTIELNLHRIPGLADNFINVNDDIIFLRPLKKDFFFKNGLPCDFAILDVLVSKRKNSCADIALMDMEIINIHFPKNKTIKNNLSKWFNIVYGRDLFKNIFLMPWNYYSNFKLRHYADPFLKSTFHEVWDNEYEVLDRTCSHKFRTGRDVNQWVLRDWQLASGKFVPSSPSGNKYFQIYNDNEELLNTIRKRNCNMLCINDVNTDEVLDYDKVKAEITSALDTVFPEKSRFEK